MSGWSVQIIIGLDTQSKFQMFYFPAAMLVSVEVHQHGGSIMGFVNLCKIFRQIFEDQENVQT